MQRANQIHSAFHHLIQSGHHEAAGWLLEKMLDDYPEHAAAHNDRAVLAHDAGDTPTAQYHYERAAGLAPDNFTIQMALAHFYHVTMGEAEKALSQYKRALALKPRDVGALIITGHLSVGMREFDQARQLYQQVLAIEPWHSEVGECLKKLDQCRPHEAAAETAELLYQRGCDKSRNGDAISAIKDFELALKKAPDYALAHNDLGVLCYNQGDKPKALEHYKQAAALDPYNAVFQKNLGDFYYAEQGDIQAALEKYVEALRLRPDDLETLLNTGQICMAVDKGEDARHFFERALEIDPDNNEAQQLIDLLNRKSSAPNASFDSRPCLEEAQSLVAQGDINGAVSHLERLLAQDPDNAMAFNDLGVLYYRSGQKEKAVACYEKAAALAPDQVIYQKNLADFYLMEQSRIEDAMKIYVGVLQNNPQDVESILAAGLVCARMNNYADARGFYQRALDIEPWNADAHRALDLLERTEQTNMRKSDATNVNALCAEHRAG